MLLPARHGHLPLVFTDRASMAAVVLAAGRLLLC